MNLTRWDVHLTAGLFAVIVLLLPFFFIFISVPSHEVMNFASFFVPTLFLGGLALVVGSVLPDIDGKGNIRWIIGPVLGIMALIPPLMSSCMNHGIGCGASFLISDGALIFLVMTGAGYLLLLLPMKHRGLLHRPSVGIAFGLVWCVYLTVCLSQAAGLSVLGGAMGTVGYLWHLALDGSLL